MGLVYRIQQGHQFGSGQDVVGEGVFQAADPVLDRLPSQPAHVAAGQAFSEGVNRHQPSGVGARPRGIEHLVFRVLEDKLPPENAGLAADGDLAARLQRPGQIPLTEPDDLQIAGLIAEHRLGVAAASFRSFGYFPGLPDRGDHRAFFAG